MKIGRFWRKILPPSSHCSNTWVRFSNFFLFDKIFVPLLSFLNPPLTSSQIWKHLAISQSKIELSIFLFIPFPYFMYRNVISSRFSRIFKKLYNTWCMLNQKGNRWKTVYFSILLFQFHCFFLSLIAENRKLRENDLKICNQWVAEHRSMDIANNVQVSN